MPIQRNRPNLEDVKGIIKSLLVATKHSCGIPVPQLDQDYRDQVGTRIPFREFNYQTLVDFLESLTGTVTVRSRSGGYVVYPVIDEKIQHVSSLVAGQRNSGRRCSRGRRSYGRSCSWTRATSAYEGPKLLCSKLLSDIVHVVQSNPGGIHINRVLQFVRYRIHDNRYDRQLLEKQLRAIPQEIVVNGDILFPAKRSLHHRYASEPRANVCNETRDRLENADKQVSNCRALNTQISSDNRATHGNILPAGSEDESDEFELVSPSSDAFALEKSQRFGEKSYDRPTSTMEDSKRHEVPKQKDSINLETKDESRVNAEPTDANSEYSENIGTLIGERMRFRLEKLVQNRPEGIWCADLPALYQKEYGISLNYEELGFTGVCDFVWYLQDIFHCVQPQELGDLKLFHAKSAKPNLKMSGRPKNLTLAELHNIYPDEMENGEALPITVTAGILETLIPEGVMLIGETVAQISVANIAKGVNEYVCVVVADVFTPTFFWIHLYSKVQKFTQFMRDLHEFYEIHKNKYVVPLVCLEKGLNVASIFHNKWHRGIIKTVAPDHTVTVMFYDYGTIHSYPPQEIYFLHKLFSSLPAQAIPCGLYNVKPVGSNKWPRTVCFEFLDQVMGTALVATIAKKDEDNNSMLVGLTNTEGAEDLHINDWMVQSGLADFGKMVCIRPPNYPYRRYLECEYAKNQNKLNEPPKKLNNKIADDKNAENVTPASVTSDRKAFYDSLLKLHRSRGKASQKKSESVFNLDSGEAQGFNEVKSQMDKNEPSFEFVMKKKCSPDRTDDKLKMGPKLLATYEEQSTVKRRFNDSSSNKCKIGTSEDTSASSKFISNERKTKEVDDKFKPNVQSRVTDVAVVPLHLRPPRLSFDGDKSLLEFGSFHSPSGGNSRMEPIDWNCVHGSANNKNFEGESSSSVKSSENVGQSMKSIRLLNFLKQSRRTQNVSGSVTPSKDIDETPVNQPNDSENAEESSITSDKSLETVKTRSKSPLPKPTSPNLPPGKKALWQLVKNQELNKRKPVDSTPEFDNFHSGTDVSGPEKAIVDWQTVRTILESPPEIGKKMPEKPVTTEDLTKIPESKIVRAEKPFLNLIEHCLVPQTEHPESLCVPEGNIKPPSYISPAVRVAINRVQKPDKNPMLVKIPKEIVNIMMPNDNDNDSNPEKKKSDGNLDENKSDEGSKKISNRSTRLLDMLKRGKHVNSNIPNVNATSVSIPTNTLDSKSSEKVSTLLNSTELTNEAGYKCKELPVDFTIEKIDKTNSKLESTIAKFDRSDEVIISGENELSSPANETTNAWIENACLKPNKEEFMKVSKLLGSRLDTTFDFELDSDDLSLESVAKRRASDKKEELTKSMKILESKDAENNYSVDGGIDNCQMTTTTTTTMNNGFEDFDSSTNNFEIATEIDDAPIPPKNLEKLPSSDSKIITEIEIAEESVSNLSVNEKQFIDIEKTAETDKNVPQEANYEPTLKNQTSDRLTVEKKIATYAGIPVFDDTAIDSDNDEWDYVPRFVMEENSENEVEDLDLDNSDENSKTQNHQLLAIEDSRLNNESDENHPIEPSTKVSTNINLSSEESSFEISDNIGLNYISGSSRPETDSDTPPYERLTITEECLDSKDYPISIGRSKSLNNWTSRKTSSLVGNQKLRNTERCNLIDKRNFEDAFKNVPLKHSNASLDNKKNYSVLSEVQKSNLSVIPKSFGNFGSNNSSDDAKSDGSSYASTLISAFKKYL